MLVCSQHGRNGGELAVSPEVVPSLDRWHQVQYASRRLASDPFASVRLSAHGRALRPREGIDRPVIGVVGCIET